MSKPEVTKSVSYIVRVDGKLACSAVSQVEGESIAETFKSNYPAGEYTVHKVTTTTKTEVI